MRDEWIKFWDCCDNHKAEDGCTPCEHTAEEVHDGGVDNQLKDVC